MTFTTFSLASAVTPTVVKTCVSHYANRKPRHKKPTAHISYDEGLHLIRSFLVYASHHTVDELQAFTAQWVPAPIWVRTENITIPLENVQSAANIIVKQLGPEGIKAVGGSEWWQWRRNGSDLRAEWVEMASMHQKRKRENNKCRRIMLYVHGGGYFFGSVDEHRYQLQRHARKLQARVIAPRYRLAPQFPFPCALQDCLAVYLYLLTVHEPSEIVMAGDSAGGGMVVSMLCMLRDQGLPLPAGAILISPWVDLTHSFPSVSEVNPLDYIPAHGFHHKPSVAWPPPHDDELQTIHSLASPASREDGVMTKTTESAANLGVTATDDNDPSSNVANRVPAPGHFLSIELNDKLVVLKEQIQMYTTNQLLSHPLVSPVLQPSLGGLPPLLILTGGAEMLRDEQIYLAHKAANPHKYPLSDIYRTKYDATDEVLNKYKPTPVQLQVWEDLCHVAPTLSFTRPAKYMYRSIAQFGAWALSRAQDRPIEITDDDNISIISSESETETPTDSTESVVKMKNTANVAPKIVGRAGDPLPFFRNHMIRQLVDRYGNISDLAPADQLPATSMDPNEVGLIKTGPVMKWIEAKDQWASKYASAKRKVQQMRVAAMKSKSHVPFEGTEKPPPSSLAARRTAQEVEKKPRKSYGLAMWSLWGSKHDEATIKREDDIIRSETDAVTMQSVEAPSNGVEPRPEASTIQDTPTTRPRRRSHRSSSRGSKPLARSQDRNGDTSSRTRRRTVSVTDRGQTGESSEPGGRPPLPTLSSASFNQLDGAAVFTPPENDTQLAQTSTAGTDLTSATDTAVSANTPLFLPKFRTAAHLRATSDDADTLSTRTGYSALSLSGASTRAVFSAPGISKPINPNDTTTTDETTQPNSSSMTDDQPTKLQTATRISGEGSSTTATPQATTPTPAPAPASKVIDGTDTPVSRLSLERLQTHNNGGFEFGNHKSDADTVDSDADAATDIGSGGGLLGSELLGARLEMLRSPSSVAVVGVEGVVGVVVDGNGSGNNKG